MNRNLESLVGKTAVVCSAVISLLVSSLRYIDALIGKSKGKPRKFTGISRRKLRFTEGQVFLWNSQVWLRIQSFPAIKGSFGVVSATVFVLRDPFLRVFAFLLIGYGTGAQQTDHVRLFFVKLLGLEIWDLCGQILYCRLKSVNFGKSHDRFVTCRMRQLSPCSFSASVSRGTLYECVNAVLEKSKEKPRKFTETRSSKTGKFISIISDAKLSIFRTHYACEQ